MNYANQAANVGVCSLEDDILDVSEDDAHALEEEVEDVGMQLCWFLVALVAAGAVQREAQVHLHPAHTDTHN